MKTKPATEIFHIRLPVDLLAEIDRQANEEGSSRANMIRMLIKRGLKFSEKGKKR